MPLVRFPAALKYYAEDQSEIRVDASTVAEAVEAVVARYPTLKFHLLDSNGNLRRHFNLFVNGEHIRDLHGMDTPLQPDDKLLLMASAAGG
jgi:molybdopterin converting factor small subunit